MNPRDKRPGERRSLGAAAGRPGNAIWYIVGFLVLVAVAQVYFSAPTGRAVTYSDFKQAVRAGQVAEITVGEQTIRGAYKRETNGSVNFNTTRIEDPKLIEELDAASVKYTGEFLNPWFSEILSGLFLLLLLFAVWSFFFRRMSGAEGGVMSFARSKHRVFAEDDVKVSFADVAGVDEAEQELKEIVEFLQNPKKYTTLGGRIPKGVLLVGPPGTGKTLLARAVAGEAKVPFFSLSGSEFVEMFVGVGAARVRDLFSQAEQKAPCIIFIDELDALGRARVQSPMGSHEEREQTLNQLLAEMDGFDSRKAIIIMGATNRPEVLDPALLRPGRFDRQVLVDKPDVRGREEVLRIHTKQVKLSPDVNLKKVAARTAGFAGADLANLVNEAALLAARKDKTSGRDARLRRGHRSADRRARKEARDEPEGARDRRVPRVRTRHRRDGHSRHGPGAQDLHRAARLRRARLHDAAAARGSLPDAAARSAQPARRAARRPHRGGDRARRDLDRRAERPAARHRHRPRDGHRVGHERDARRDQLRRQQAQQVPRHPDWPRAWRLRRGNRAAHRQRGEAHHDRRARRTARELLSERRDMLEAVTRRLLEQEVMEGDELREILGVPMPTLPEAAAEQTPLPPVEGVH